MSMQIERDVIARIPKFDDVEVHVSTVKAQGQEYVEIREYVPSLEQYGKGLTLSFEAADAVWEALDSRYNDPEPVR